MSTDLFANAPPMNQAAIQLATEQINQMSRKLSIRERIMGFAKPGPKPKLSEQTYRGRYSNLGWFLNENKEYKPSMISYDTLDRMRRNGMVALGLAVKNSPVYAAMREAEIRCPDDDVREFLIQVFQKPFLMNLAKSCLTAYVFGIAFHEKVWKREDLYLTTVGEDGEERVVYDGYALVPKKYKLNDVRTIDSILVQKKTQDFAGYVQRAAPGEKDTQIDAWQAFVFATNTLYRGLWGEPSLWYAYPYWYYCELFRALQADWLRTRAINPLIGRFPPGKNTNQDGNEVDNATWGGDVLRAAYDAMVIMLPQEKDEDGDYVWSYSELNLSSEAGEVYQVAIDNLETMILRSLVVPERTVTQATRAGGYNEAMAHLDAFFEAAKDDIESLVFHVDHYAFPQLIEWNFADKFTRLPKAYLDARTFSEQLKFKLFSLLTALVQNDRPDTAILQHVAIEDLLEILNVPIATPAQKEETRETIEKEED